MPSTTGFFMSIQARIIKAFTRRTIKRDGLNEQQLVRHLRRVFNHSPTLSLIPRGVKKRDIDTNTFHGEHLATRDPQVTVLYIHGVAYIRGVPRTYHNMAGRLATQLDGEVYLVKSPVSPQNPFPAAVNCQLDAYLLLLAEGKTPETIDIAG